MKNLLRNLAGILTVRDAFALAGLALIFAGCWWIYPPSALLTCGALLLSGAIWGHVHAPVEDPREE